MSVIILVGPTCSGKTSVEKALRARGMSRLISHTTRPQRPGEIDGQDYNFATEEEFDRLVFAGRFIETSSHHGARYGTSYGALIGALGENNPHIAVVMEPRGATNLRRHCEKNGVHVLTVWLDCSPYTQASRFLDRPMDDESRCRRLAEMLSVEQDWREAWARMPGRADLWLSSDRMSPEEIASAILSQLNPCEELDSHGL